MTAQILQHRDLRPAVPVIDLFAGPGGLGEGFSAYAGPVRFNVALSVEKDQSAHRTLELRSFVRQFPRGMLPDEYYAYVRGQNMTRESLFDAYPEQTARATSIAWQAELGKERYANVDQRLRNALGNTAHWVLLGGPPCQAYSIIGRARMGKMENFAEDHRHTLYREYLKIVAAFQPTVFVMENVKGILTSKHKDQAIFGQILSDLRHPWNALSAADRREIGAQRGTPRTYRILSFSTPFSVWNEELNPEDYIIKSERYAVPQKRHRVILLGVRDDYDVVPPVLEPASGTITVRDILDGMPQLRSRLSGNDRSGYWWRAAVRRGVSDCTANSKDRFRGLGTVVREALANMSDSLGTGGRFVPGGAKPKRLGDWLFDACLGGVLQHESRAHMQSDLHRYMFCACFAKMKGVSPKLHEFPDGLFPQHRNAVTGDDGKVADFADRFRVQTWNDASTTITSHIAKDGHYFIHPDACQCRSLTVREAARLQTFPDNYFFEGNRTAQYHQIGNAVPPFLAFQLADVVSEVIQECILADQRARGAGGVRRIGGP